MQQDTNVGLFIPLAMCENQCSTRRHSALAQTRIVAGQRGAASPRHAQSLKKLCRKLGYWKPNKERDFVKPTYFSQKPITFHLSLLPVAKKLKTNRGKCNSQFLLFHETALNHLVRLSYGFMNTQDKEKGLPGQDRCSTCQNLPQAGCRENQGQLIVTLDDLILKLYSSKVIMPFNCLLNL